VWVLLYLLVQSALVLTQGCKDLRRNGLPRRTAVLDV